MRSTGALRTHPPTFPPASSRRYPGTVVTNSEDLDAPELPADGASEPEQAEEAQAADPDLQRSREEDHQLLLQRLHLVLPPQPPPRIAQQGESLAAETRASAL